MFSLDIGGLDDLIRDLEKASKEVEPKTRQVVSRGALNVKKDWQRAWSGIGHAPRIPRSIDYDLHSGAGEVSAEIGPNRALGPALQGFLGRVLEYGGIHSGPQPGGLPAADHEEPKFVRAMGDLGEKLLEGR